MATAAGRPRRFFFSGRMAPEIDDARMTADAAVIAVSGLRELNTEGVSVMASLTLTDGNGRLRAGIGKRCERGQYRNDKAEKRNKFNLLHVVSQAHGFLMSSASRLFFNWLLFRFGDGLLPFFHAAEQSRHFKSFSRQIACCNK